MSELLAVVAQDLRTILLLELFRWFFVGAFIVRLFSVMLFNHLTWRKLASLTFVLSTTGALAVLGIAWLDESLEGVAFHGYPETFMIVILLAYGLGQMFAKLLLVVNEAGFRERKRAQQARAQQLLARARRITRQTPSRSFLKG